MELGGFGKDTCFSDETHYPYEDSCDFLVIHRLCRAKSVVGTFSFNEGNNPLNSKCYHKYIVANLSEMIRSVSGIRYNRQNNAQKGKEFLIEPNHNMEIYMKKRLHKYP